MESNKSNLECINGLVETPKYAELQKLDAKFDLLALFDDAIRENSWSRILAYLFRSEESHGLGYGLFEAWISEIESETHSKLSISFCNGYKTTAKTECSTDEGRRVDVVVNLTDTSKRIVGIFGIENKIDAGEQQDQLADYQKWISKKYSIVKSKFLFFLTPDGRPSQTANKDDNCEVVACSYKTICIACKRILPLAEVHVKILIEALVEHLEGQTKLSKQAEIRIAELFENPDHRRAINLIVEHRPCMEKVIGQVQLRLRSGKVFQELRNGHEDPHVKPWPKNSSKDASHWDFYFPEIMSPGKNIKLSYCLANISLSDHKVAEINDTFSIGILAWVPTTGSARIKAEKLKKLCKLPKMANDWSDQAAYWSGNVFFWGGASYTLVDLSVVDVEGLTLLIEGCVEETYNKLLNAIARTCAD